MGTDASKRDETEKRKAVRKLQRAYDKLMQLKLRVSSERNAESFHRDGLPFLRQSCLLKLLNTPRTPESDHLRTTQALVSVRPTPRRIRAAGHRRNRGSW